MDQSIESPILENLEHNSLKSIVLRSFYNAYSVNFIDTLISNPGCSSRSVSRLQSLLILSVLYGPPFNVYPICQLNWNFIRQCQKKPITNVGHANFMLTDNLGVN